METDGTFNRLVSELSLDERNNLLDKLNSQTSMAKDLLYLLDDTAPAMDIEEEYKQLPWYYQLWYFILSFFRQKPPKQLFAEQMVFRLGRVIEAQAPGLYDCHDDLLLPEFHKELVSLKEGSRFFYTALDSSVNRDRGAFYAFLASLEMGEVHQRLTTETDPEYIVNKQDDISESELRQTAFRAMEDALAAITEEQRTAMYYDVRLLNCLKELSAFLFDRVILAFAVNASYSGAVCSARLVKDQLLNLNNILFSLKETPPMTLLESLFIFILQEHTGEPGFQINTEMRNLLTKAENAVAAIRDFNRHVPLTLILRCMFRNLSLSPKVIGGGEDWFVVYREYWKRHIELHYAEYMRERRHRELTNSFKYFFKGTNLKILGNVISESNPNGLPVGRAFSLSFLMTFYSVVFMGDINKAVRPILIDGEFYKRENRTEFTESYNELIKMEDTIKKFEESISPSGDLGKRFIQARNDMSSLPVKRRKVQMVVEEASGEAERIVERCRDAICRLINILNGIIKPDSDGKYDTLANMSALSGRGNSFVNGVVEAIQ
ncbi:MAG: DUF5312 domain-containing protein, partial [Treponema sp.]|nr:DUF5312 domain-containing protein [Treponema sp.]